MPGLGDEEVMRALGAYNGSAEPVAEKPKNYTPKPPQMTPVPNPYKGMERMEMWDHIWRDLLDEFEKKNGGRDPNEQEWMDLRERGENRMNQFGSDPLNDQEIYDWLYQCLPRKEGS